MLYGALPAMAENVWLRPNILLQILDGRLRNYVNPSVNIYLTLNTQFPPRLVLVGELARLSRAILP